MSTSFPTSLDNFSNPLSSDLLNAPSAAHATQHSNINDAIEAIEAKLGITNSEVSSSIEYRLAQIETMSGITVVRHTSLQWESLDPDLLETQIGLETDTLKFKFGTGASWLSIGYCNVTPADLDSSLGDYIPIGDRGNLNGVASLDSNGLIPDSEIPSTITRDTELSSHASDTTSIHGIADTAELATKTYADSAVSTHNSDTTNVHGISDTSALATKTYADTAAANAAAAIVDSAPSALNTLNELAAAINDDASYAATITTALGNKQDKVSGVSDTEIGYLDGVTSSIQSQINGKASQSNVDLKADKLIEFNQQSSSYTLALSDNNKVIEMSSGGNLTIPAESSVSLPDGFAVEILQTGSSQVTIVGESGSVVINSTPGLKIRTQWSSASLIKRGTNLWLASGDLSA